MSIRLIQKSRLASTSKFGVALDIDGVLIRGGQCLKGTRRALEMLNGDNKHNRQIPHVFLTNGGGLLEKKKAEKLSAVIGMPVDAYRMIQCHTPMRSLSTVPELRDGPILVIGPSSCKEVMLSYGFKRPVMSTDVLSWHPSIWPFRQVPQSAAPFDINDTPFRAVFVCHDSRDWGLDVQVACDVLRSEDGYLGTLSPSHHQPDFRQSVPLYFSNPDFTWANDFSVPRFAQGAFRLSMERLYYELTGHNLVVAAEYGKPFKAMYDYAKQQFREQAGGQSTIERVYGIGDNVSSDIVGANQAGWQSVLVKTGVWQEDQGFQSPRKYHLPSSITKHNSKDRLQELITPKLIVEDVKEAIEKILEIESGDL
ncbi:hypothetical protein MP228_000960 [Amoeboaphelidium protococcarum]|nr:hypothetical protein MP228_000960 [Amoeboaphelidium protococcarum]